jgi:hypothetical protein
MFAVIKCIKIENVLHEFTQPCVMDVKVGTRVHGEDASPEKAARMEEQARITTSLKTGLRICGMKVGLSVTAPYTSRH